MEKFDNRFEKIRSINNIVITSNEFMAAFMGIQDCVKRSISYSEPVGSMLLAEGGLGKTTLCKAILSLMPRSEKIEKDHKKSIIPVCYVEVPSPATVKSLAIMMLKELGDLTCENGYGTTEYLTSRLIHLLAQCETKLIFLDEFHHLFERKPTSTRMNRTTGNWIKTLVNRTGISFCLVGLPEFVPLLQIDSQIARRFPFIYHLNPLTVDTSQGGSMFAFLAEISRTLNKQNITNIELFFWIISTFRKFYPNVGHPIGGSSGDRNPWDASEFIISIIQQLAKNHSDQACDALQKLKDSSTDDYTDLIKVMLFEQKQMRADSFYSVPTLQSIKAITADQQPQTIIDLQTFVLDELNIVQAKIKSDDAESWRGFFNDQGKPFEEERCRDHLIGLLRQGDNTITYEPEAHVANDKEVDITCSVGKLRLPIEIKGQWHRDLWTGADQQLDKLYTTDWRAEGRGIYLVLWFDKRSDNKKLKTLGRGKPVPNTPKELQEMLIANSRSAQEGKIQVVVINCNRTAS